MAKNKLEIFISLVTAQAEKADQNLHAGMRQRIKQTSDAQANVDKEYIKALKLKDRAIRDFVKTLEARYSAEVNTARKAAQQRDADEEKISKQYKRRDADRRKSARERYQEELRLASQNLSVLSRMIADEMSRRKAAAGERVKLARMASRAEIDSAKQAAQAMARITEGIANNAKALRDERGKVVINQHADEVKIAKASSKERALTDALEAAMFKQGRSELIQFIKTKSSEHVRLEQETSKLSEAAHVDANRDMVADDKMASQARWRIHQQELKQKRYAREEETIAYRRSNEQKTEADRARNAKLDAITKARIKSTTKGLDAEKEGILSVAKAYTTLRVASEVGQYVTAAMQTMARSSAEARDYIIRIVQEMERAREISKELANLEGKPATGAYTADQARQASAVGATPEEFVAGKKGYQEFGAQYVGKEGATKDERAEEVKDKKVAYEVSQETQRRAMKMFGAMGLDPTQGMKLMATVTGKMSKENPNVTADEIILQTRKLAEAARTATGATGVGIEQLQGSIQESVGESGDLKSMEEAAVIMRTMQEVDPNEGKMLSRNLLRGLHDIRQNKKGEADELGITKDMDTMQQLAQAAKRIPEIAAETGESEADVEQRLFKDSREYRAAKAVFNQGMKGGGFGRTRKALDSITKESERKEESDYTQSEIFAEKSQNSMITSAERERATRMNPLQGYKREAKRALAASGELEKPENILGAAATMGGQALGQGDRAAQEERALQVAELKRRLKGTPGGRKWLKDHPGMSSTEGAIAALSWGLIKPSGRYADESWMGEAALEIEKQRKNNPIPNAPVGPTQSGKGSDAIVYPARENPTSADMMHADQQQSRAAAANLNAAAANMNKATKLGVPAPLPSRPHVQRH